MTTSAPTAPNGANPSSPAALPPLEDVLREHVEEFAYLSLLRGLAQFDAQRTTAHLSQLDSRLEAHWDGLIVGCPQSLEMAAQMLTDGGDPWDVATALRLWCMQGKPTTEAIVALLAAQPEEALPAWREGLCHCTAERVASLLPESLLGHESPAVVSTLLFVHGWHGLLSAWQATRFLHHEQPLVRYCLARTIGWSDWSAEERHFLLTPLAADSDALVRRAALWSAALSDPQTTADHIRTAGMEAADPFALQVLALIGGPEDVPLLLSCTEQETTATAALEAIATLGAPQAIDPLLPLLDQEPLAPLAMQTVQAILGPQAKLLIEPTLQPGESTTEPPLLQARIAAWQQLQPSFAGAERILNGLAFPWTGPAEAEPCLFAWLRQLPDAAANRHIKTMPPVLHSLLGDNIPSLGV